MLDQLDQQKDDVYDLASIGVSDSDSDSDSYSDSNSDNSGDNINGNNNNSVNGRSGGNPVESNNNDSSYHAQDSSDVVQTDFPSLILSKNSLFTFMRFFLLYAICYTRIIHYT